MNKIAELHLEAFTHTEYNPEDKVPNYVGIAKASAEITEQIAVEFCQWLDYNAQQREYYPMRIMTTKELFQEFLKTNK